MSDYLIFIDTNILLDFYRQGFDPNLSILKRLDQNVSRFITTAQVEMEFKKNRQAVILKAYEELKAPEDLTKVKLPAFLGSSTEGKDLKRLADQIKKHVGVLRTRLSNILEN